MDFQVVGELWEEGLEHPVLMEEMEKCLGRSRLEHPEQLFVDAGGGAF